jgi:hypothetical protein
MNTKPILYDLGIATASITLWLTPFDATRALGYSLSILFSGRAYYSGVMLLADERKTDEKQAIAYEADTEYFDQLLGTHVDSQLEVRTLEIENQKLKELIPLIRINQQLETQLQQLQPIHPELTDEDKQQAAKQAINGAFETPEPINEQVFRKQFPENMDNTYWKAICKALANGATKDEVIKDVLGCASNAEVGRAYYEWLKNQH